jgi:PAS domain S-box-containing protein
MAANIVEGKNTGFLDEVRDRLLTIALGSVFSISSFSLIVSFINENGSRYMQLAAFLFLGVALFVKPLGRIVRFGILFVSIFFIGTMIMAYDGVESLGLLFYVFTIFLAATLMGRTAGYAALGLCEAATILLADSLITGRLVMESEPTNFPDSWAYWIHVPIVLFLVSVFVIASIDFMLTKLQNSLSQSQDLVGELRTTIQERIQAEQELIESREQYKLLADNVHDVVWLLDLDMNTIFVSPSITNQRGFTAAEIFGKELGEVVVAEHVPVVLGRLEKELALDRASPHEPGRSFSVEYEVYKKDGSTIWVESVFNYLRDQNNNPTHLVATTRDVSERKLAELENTALQQQVQQAQKMESLGVLAGGIAHDFNNLLLGVMGNADLALLNVNPTDGTREYIQDIMSSAQRAADLCRQLLAYSGKGRFVVQPIDLSEIVYEMTQLLDVSIQKNVTVRYQMEKDLPAVEADVTQMQQVIMNLVINASDAIGDDPGSISITIEKHAYDTEFMKSLAFRDELPAGEYVVMEISDTGCGMDEHTQERIFDPFFTTKEMGHGLGLAAAVGIVQGHGGGLKVYSEAGKGTTIKVVLPSTNKNAISIKSKSEALIKNTGSGMILVVDDEKMIRDFAKKTLEKAGYTVLVAENGQVALEFFREHEDEIKLVLLDMTMPVMGGEETYRELRQLDSNVKTILSSGFNEQDATSRFVGKGVAGFIQKPYRVADLIGIVQQTIGEE